MDISDHQLSSHGFPLMKLPSQFSSYHGMPPLDYVNNFHHLDYPNINHAAQLPSIPFIADSPSSLIHYANQPYLMFPSMNMSSISQSDLPRSCTTTFDYPFNQIYHDCLPSSIFNYGVDQQALPTCEANYYKGLTYPSNHEELADPFPTTTAKPYTFARQDEDAATRRVNMEVKSEITMPNYGPSSLFSDVSIPLAPTFLHSLVDMESHHVKEDAYNDSTASFNDLAPSTSADCFDLPLPSFNSAIRENPISQSKRPLHAKESNSSTTEASCSHAGNVISTATACKTRAPKKRKSQQKRVVCVRATGGLDKPTGECLPSDSWAWRKYGQKAIKGSPYPRSYYRCSSLKGCTARKQVERNPSDPLMIIMIYTSDHNHPPTAGRQATKKDDELVRKDSNKRISGDVNDQISEESCEPNSSEDNNNGNNMSDTNIFNTAHHHNMQSDDQEQGLSSTTVEESLAFNNNQGLLLSSNHENMQARSDRKLLEEDFFAQLDELPDWSSGGNPLDARLDHIIDQEGINHGANSMDPFDLFDWS